MTYVLITLAAVIVIIFSILCKLKAEWNMIEEGITVYRYLPDSDFTKQYKVVVLGDHKYLADMSHQDPHMKYDFWDYVEDMRYYRIYTEDQMDSFD